MKALLPEPSQAAGMTLDDRPRVRDSGRSGKFVAFRAADSRGRNAAAEPGETLQREIGWHSEDQQGLFCL